MYASTRSLRRRGAGIVGLPNIGKSTLFNAMTCSQQAKTGNFPFCTINANLSKVPVYDDRLRQLAKFTGAEKIVDVEVDLADVAGLIEGASKGAGLGNKFLADIRPVNVILHMVRCFESAKDGFDAPDPLADVRTIMNELVLSDIEAVEKRLTKLRSRKSGDKELVVTQKMLDWLNEGKPAKDAPFAKEVEPAVLRAMGLLSGKPMLFVLNVDDNSMVGGNRFSAVMEQQFGVDNTVRVCSVVEEQCAQFTREERLAFLKEYGVETPATDVLLQKVFRMLRLQSFYTVGPKMAHGWAIEQGTKAAAAAGEIHGDFETHFRAAYVMPWHQYVTFPNYKQAEGKMKKVDKFHELQDGDVFIVDHEAGGKK